MKNGGKNNSVAFIILVSVYKAIFNFYFSFSHFITSTYFS